MASDSLPGTTSVNVVASGWTNLLISPHTVTLAGAPVSHHVLVLGNVFVESFPAAQQQVRVTINSSAPAQAAGLDTIVNVPAGSPGLASATFGAVVTLNSGDLLQIQGITSSPQGGLMTVQNLSVIDLGVGL